MPIAMTQEQQALQASLRDWAKRAGTRALVRAQEPGGHTEQPPLAEIAALGVFAMPQDGGTVTDLAVALEQLAHDLAPGPVPPIVLAAALLARHGGQPGYARELLSALGQARTSACVALSPGTLTGTASPTAPCG